MKYRKKPVVIDAFQWTGGPNQTEDPAWVVEAIKNGTIKVCRKWLNEWTGEYSLHMLITSIEGHVFALPGDYIIRGINGEIYPCKPDIFHATYDPVIEEIQA